MRNVAKILCSAAVLLPSFASAQFGMPQLPSTDFTWRWARAADAADAERGLGPEDFDVRGGEVGFQCVLTGALSPGSHITDQQLKEMEYELTGSVFFIQASAQWMNDLEVMREISWAVLDCKKGQAAEEDPEKVEAEVDRARQKAVEEMLKRRERAQRGQ
jgi:hypothetical protein